MLNKKRVLVLPVAFVIIACAVAYKLTREYPAPDFDDAVSRQPVPLFEALDHENRIVKFERYVGRHQVLLTFFDGKLGVDKDPLMLKLRSAYEFLQQKDIVVVGVSTAIPQQNRQAFESSGEFPFPILSDPGKKVYQAWGLDGTPKTAFWIDRGGQVQFDQRPIAVEDPMDFVDRLVSK